MSDTLPYVKINLLNNQLGQSAASEDGTTLMVVSGVSVSGKFALGDLLGPYVLPTDANADGIDAAYDSTNVCLAYKHISDFFDSEATRGTELYVIVLANTVTMEDICDKDESYLAPILEQLGGKIKLVAVTRVPDATYQDTTMTTDTGFDDDVNAAVLTAKELVAREQAANRPIRIMIEGRNFTGVAADAFDYVDIATSPQSNGTMVFIGSNTVTAAEEAEYEPYAAVGYAIGILAGIQVHRNMGRVASGSLSIPEAEAGFSNGAGIKTLDETKWELLNKKGYVFFKTHQQLAGVFFNDDHTTTVTTDDYNKISNGRVIDKAQRITHAVYLQTVLDDFDTDFETGKISPAVLKDYEGRVENAINSQMISIPQGTSGKVNEITGSKATVDPFQDVISTGKILVKIGVGKKGIQRYLEADLGFQAPSAA